MRTFENVKFVNSLSPVARSANANGTGVDTQGFSDGVVIINAGVIGGTSPTFAYTVQESDDNSAWSANISGMVANITASNTTKCIRIGDLTSRKRYLRVVLTVGGTSPTTVDTAVFALGMPYSAPVGNVQS